MFDTLSSADFKLLSKEDLLSIFGKERLAWFKTTPFAHQLATALWACGDDRRVFPLLGIGTGKTYTSLIITRLRGCKRTLVVCPNSVKSTWAEEIPKHTYFSYCILQGTTEERKQLLATVEADIYVTSYPGLKLLFGKKVAKVNNKGEKVNKFVLDDEALMRSSFDNVIFDEAHHLRGLAENVLQARIAYRLSAFSQCCTLLTGSPYGRNEGDFWSMFMVLDRGATLGTSYAEFMYTHFNRFEIIVRGFKIPQWSLKKGHDQIILDKIAPKVLRYETRECVDLQSIVYEQRRVELTNEQLEYYDRILDGIDLEFRNGQITLSNIESKAQKLAQVCSGFVYVAEGQGEVIPGRNPKLDELIDLLDETNEKIVIFHSWIYEAELIEKRLGKEKVRFASLRGGIKHPDEQLAKFRTESDCRVMVLHPSSGGEGLNLQCASVAVFFSSVQTSPITRDQAVGRIHRSGQTHSCVVIDLLTRFGTRQRQTVEEVRNEATVKKVNYAELLLRSLSSKD